MYFKTKMNNVSYSDEEIKSMKDLIKRGVTIKEIILSVGIIFMLVLVVLSLIN